MTSTRSSMLVLALVAGLAAPASAVLQAEAPSRPVITASALSGPAVTVARAIRAEIVQSVVVSGSIVARDEVMVVPEVDGLAIVEVLAEAGDYVFAGQVLARLSRTSFDVQKMQNRAQTARAEAAIALAKAQLAEAEANRQQAVNAFDRSRALREGGNTTLDIYDQRAAAARAAQARAEAAEQALAIASADLAVAWAQGRDIDVKLARTEIKAPAAGIIGRRSARLGAMAPMAATEPLFRIFADAAVEFEADVAEVELSRLKLEQKVAVTPAGSTNPVGGIIRLIAPEVDRLSRLGKVRVSLGGIAPIAIGSFARGVIEVGRRKSVTLPLSAIAIRDGATTQVVKDGRVETRRVSLGLMGGGRVEIASGLAEGETVVARAGTFVRDGDLVTPVPTN